MKKVFYRRNLPHWQPDDAVLFITARLHGSLPKEVVLSLKEERELYQKHLEKEGLSEKELKEALQQSRELYFGKFDDLLDNNKTGPHWLKNERVAQIWVDALKYFDNERYKVICSTTMSNHVHFIFYQLKQPIRSIMHSLKSYTANEVNKILGREGRFWQEESFDRVVRNQEDLGKKINYVLDNPVKIGVVSHWSKYKYNYIHPDFKKYIK